MRMFGFWRGSQLSNHLLLKNNFVIKLYVETVARVIHMELQCNGNQGVVPHAWNPSCKQECYELGASLCNMTKSSRKS